MLPTLLDLAQRLQDTSIGTTLAESRYAFPVVEGVHLVGLSLSVGLLAVIDLRLMGVFMRSTPLREVLEHLRPWAIGGFAMTFLSGLLLFSSEAVIIIKSPAFAWKMAFIGLAALNALSFEYKVSRWGAALQELGTPPRAVRYAGFASLSLWILAIAFGRLIPYLSPTLPS